jgi:hypothetical protein
MEQILTKAGALYRTLWGRSGASGDDSRRASDRSVSDAEASEKHSREEMLAPRAYASKTELVAETGVSPRDYLRAVLEAHDGRLSQRDMCEHTGWSSSTISCLLGQMDDRGDVVQIRLGRETLVFLPDAVPDIRDRERESPGERAIRPGGDADHS